MPDQKLLNLLKSATEKLSRIRTEAPRLNAERIMCSVLDCERVDLYLEPDRTVSAGLVVQFESLLNRRLAFEPLQYILGETEFYGFRIKCDRRALIPRPETEFVVSQAISLLENFDKLYILDLACGTGCIGIALAHNLPQAEMTASDISQDAISLAKENVVMHNLIKRYSFHTGDLFEAVKSKGTTFDAVVCNPPYIRQGDLQSLAKQIRDHEPLKALLSGPDGLDFIRRMLKGISDVLVPGGYLVFEMGLGQAEVVNELVDATESLDFVGTVMDYSNVHRVAVARRSR